MNDFGFDPKEKLWKQDLKTLGVEHSIEPVTLSLIGAGISGISSIFGGMNASSNAKKQQRAEDKRVEALNDYNEEK